MNVSPAARGPAAGRLARTLLRSGQGLIEIMVVAMALLICAEVVCRAFLGFSLMVTDEIAGYLLVALTFLGMPVTMARGALFRVELVLNRLPARLRAWLELGFNLLSLALTLVLLRELWRFAVDSWQRGVRAPTVLATPLYLPQAVMVLGMGALAGVLVVQVVRDVRRIRTGAGDE
ncbi:TRAP transporter small permease [Pulveribacter sp.]|uniref:TRAP transporter small permease n=1 Tax=Pulveribacter sp. TaxID=2678893 RepID=UPI0028B0F628|nr:TRAP transporter small permease [Pulveribacter sp.]